MNRAQALRELESAGAELSLFTAGAAHDLQGPVRKIQALAARQLELPGRRPEVRRDLARIGDLAAQMRALLEYLLAYEQAKTAPIEVRDLDANEALVDVLVGLRPKIQAAHARMSSSPLPSVRADPIQLRQALHHVIDNAVKFHAAGRAPAVDIGGRRLRGGGCQLWVDDDGIGIAGRYLDQIFLPFKRLNCADAYEGNGLGLAICRRIMDRHRGSIEVRSTPGRGARFILTFPEGSR